MRLHRIAPALALVVIGWGANQFAPLVVAYQTQAGMPATHAQALFVLYAIGLVPGLFAGGLASDRLGRRRVVMASLGLSGLSTLILWAGTAWMPSFAGLAAGRLLAGLASGIGFSAGAAWVREAAGPTGARTAVVAMTAGFGGGPLVAGLIAAALPSQLGLAYTPHVALTAVTLALLAMGTREAPRTLAGAMLNPQATGLAAAVAGPHGIWGDPVFRRVVAPLAPWVFLTAAVALASVPGALRAGAGAALPWFSALVTPLPALTGVLVQGWAKRLDGRLRAQITWAMGFSGLGLALGTAAVVAQSLALATVACAVLGMAYGLCQTVGMQQVALRSPPGQLGRSMAIYQTLTYAGYLAPLPIAMTTAYVRLPTILATLAAAALLVGAWLRARLSALEAPHAPA